MRVGVVESCSYTFIIRNVLTTRVLLQHEVDVAHPLLYCRVVVRNYISVSDHEVVHVENKRLKWLVVVFDDLAAEEVLAFIVD